MELAVTGNMQQMFVNTCLIQNRKSKKGSAEVWHKHFKRVRTDNQ